MSHNNDITCSIYVASLADYNAGSSHGTWISLNDCSDVEELQETIGTLLKYSPEGKRTGTPAEEWAIHDYEGLPNMGENTGLDDIWFTYKAIEEHGEAWIEYAEHVGVRYATLDGFEEAYQGEYRSEKDFAEELFDEVYLHEVPEHVRFYIDYERFARDLFCGDYFMTDGGHVFRNC